MKFFVHKSMNAQTFFPSGRFLLKSNSFCGEGMIFELGGVFTVAAMLFYVSSRGGRVTVIRLLFSGNE